MATRQHIYYYDGLRGFAAFQVYNQHLWLTDNLNIKGSLLSSILEGNRVAVSIFFVLSGRIIGSSIIANPTLKNTISAFVRRPARLIIPVMGSLIVQMIFGKLGYFGNDNVANNQIKDFGDIFFLLMNLFFFNKPINCANTYLFITWTMPIEMRNSFLVYSVAILASYFKHKILLYIPVILLLITLNDWGFIFILGLALAEISNAKIFEWIKSRRLVHWPLQLILAILPILQVNKSWELYYTIDRFHRKWMWNVDKGFGMDILRPKKASHLPSLQRAIFAVCVVALLELNTVMQWFFSTYPMRMLGKYSFSFYLLHPIWFKSAGNWIKKHYFRGGMNPKRHLLLYLVESISFIPLNVIFTETFDQFSVYFGSLLQSVLLKDFPMRGEPFYKKWAKCLVKVCPRLEGVLGFVENGKKDDEEKSLLVNDENADGCTVPLTKTRRLRKYLLYFLLSMPIFLTLVWRFN